MSRKSLTIAGLCVFVLVYVGGIWSWHWLQEEMPEAPKTLMEAKKRVEGAGYHVPLNPRNKKGGDFSYVVTLSRDPMTWEDQSCLLVSSSKEAWAGKARIYVIQSGDSRVEDVSMKPGLVTVQWGKDLIVVGDPDLVNEIIRLKPLPFESKVQNQAK